MKDKEAIGIIGGMGPEASVYIYKLLIEFSVKYFGAKNNDDFPEIVLHSIPVPDLISSNKKKKEALKMLKKRVEDLNNLNLSSLSIACNTVHILIDDLKKISKIPFISMIDKVVEKVYEDKKFKVGLLGTPSTIRSNIYQKKLEEYEIDVITPTKAQFSIMEIAIRNVIAGEINKKDEERLIEIADKLKDKGAEGIILGCTEMPLIFPNKYSLPLYNSLEILAMALLRSYYK